MKEIVGDIWNYWERGNWIVIPTNGNVNKYGCAIMGKGLALEAKERFPNLSYELGRRLSMVGINLEIFFEYRIIAFPVKYDWTKEANLELISSSADSLSKCSVANFLREGLIYLPRVGCGKETGKLDWKIVKPVLEVFLDDRFTVVNLPKERK